MTESNDECCPPVIEDDPTAPIDRFRGRQYGFLSNFHPCYVFYGVHKYSTVEAAYQAAKTMDFLERQRIREAASPFMAKRIGGTVTLRPDWREVKLAVMADLLWQKFLLNLEFREMLLATGDRQLIEGGVGDTFFGVDKYGHGKNYLGKLLMALRETAKIVNGDLPGKK